MRFAAEHKDKRLLLYMTTFTFIYDKEVPLMAHPIPNISNSLTINRHMVMKLDHSDKNRHTFRTYYCI
ncbi:MAG: hypothetical protein ACJAZJ_000440 [Candidatus Endobugula sp.]|jgi:hypothetical protein